ncbi:ABC transporter ATP-binding protein [Thermoproteota archaeon]
MVQHLKRFLYFGSLILPFWHKLVLSIFVENAVQLALLLPPLVLRVLFDYAYPNKDIKLLLIFASIPFVFTFFLNFLMVCRSFIDLYVDQQLLKSLYKKVYSTLQRLPLRYFYTHRIGELIYKMTNDVRVIERTVLNTIPSGLTAIIKLTVLLIICFSLNKGLTVLALAGIPIHFWQTHFFSSRLKGYTKDKEETNSQVYDLLEERLSNIKLIKLFHRWAVEVNVLLKQIGRLFYIERKSRLANSMHSFLLVLTSRFWALILAVYAGFLVINDQLTIGEIVAITTYIAMLQTPFDTLIRLYKQFVMSQVSFQRISEILNRSVEIPEDAEFGLDKNIKGQLTFENVSFGYDKHNLILKNLNFTLEPGKSIAILGKSGIGKSSIVDLILRFYSVSGGRILLDGIEINAFKLASLRRQIGLISHEANLFFGSIKENISFGFEYEISDERIIEAAKKADAHDFIMAFPDGYNTEVGPKGIRLSSGQRQRIAIARAIVNDPKILIFDEATSVLDTESQKQIHITLENFKGKKTVILIAHRLSSIKNVDTIIVLGNDGTIAEHGPVLELMNKDSIFKRLYEAETGGFQYFIQQLNFVLKSAKRSKRTVCVGMLLIKNFSDLPSLPNVNSREFLVEDIQVAISRFINEGDFFSYNSGGQFFLAFPDTTLAGAKKICNNLMTHLSDVHFEEFFGKKLLYDYTVVRCLKDDVAASITERLLKQCGSNKS